MSFQPRDVPTGPVTALLGAGQLIPGLEEVLAGMRPGSKRRALVPPSAGVPQSGRVLFLVHAGLLAGVQSAVRLLQGMRTAQTGYHSRPRLRHSASCATTRASPCSLRCKCCAYGRPRVQRERTAGGTGGVVQLFERRRENERWAATFVRVLEHVTPASPQAPAAKLAP